MTISDLLFKYKYRMLLLMAAVYVLSFAYSYALLILYRLVLGISQAMLSPAAYGLIAESFSGNHSIFCNTGHAFPRRRPIPVCD